MDTSFFTYEESLFYDYGVMTLNEIRYRHNLAPVAGGDVCAILVDGKRWPLEELDQWLKERTWQPSESSSL